MAKLTKDLPLTIGFRATAADARKLAALAELTHRGQGDVLRLLLRQAVVAGIPDIQFKKAPGEEICEEETLASTGDVA